MANVSKRTGEWKPTSSSQQITRREKESIIQEQPIQIDEKETPVIIKSEKELLREAKNKEIRKLESKIKRLRRSIQKKIRGICISRWSIQLVVQLNILQHLHNYATKYSTKHNKPKQQPNNKHINIQLHNKLIRHRCELRLFRNLAKLNTIHKHKHIRD